MAAPQDLGSFCMLFSKSVAPIHTQTNGLCQSFPPPPPNFKDENSKAWEGCGVTWTRLWNDKDIKTMTKQRCDSFPERTQQRKQTLVL